MDAKTQKSELTRATIVGAAMELAAAQGLEAISLQTVANRVGLSKSGVFSRIGSREALQKAVVDEYGHRFLADVFVPAMQLPRGLPRLNEIMRRWSLRVCQVEVRSGCIFTAGAFELHDREGELRDHLVQAISGWRAALRRTVQQAITLGQLRADTDADQLVGELYSLVIGLLHDARFMRDPRAIERTQTSWTLLIASYQA